MTTSISQEYFALFEKYRNQYGPKIVVLMQLGNFHNIFEYIPEHDPNPHPYYTSRIGNAHEISEIAEMNCEVHVYAKSKPYGFENPYSIGFPMVAYDEKRQILLNKDYVIIKYDQVSEEIDKSTKRTKRDVTEIESQHVSWESSKPSNKIVSLYIENHKANNKFEDMSIIVGLSYLDFQTGENGISELYSVEKNQSNALHETYRALSIIRPNEIIINIGKYPSANMNKEEIEKYRKSLASALELDAIPHVLYQDNIYSEYFKPNFHTEYLNRIFTPSQFIVEELGLERMYYGRISYICLLQICYQHNKLMVAQIEKPVVQFMDEDKYLILTHNAMKQLNILSESKDKIDSLMALMDKTNTMLGRRFLMNRLCNPLLNRSILQKNYDQIEDLTNNKGLLPDLNRSLAQINDLQKMHRKMKLHVITPKEFALTYKSYRQIEELYELIDKSGMENIKLLINRDKLLEMMRCRSYLISNLNLDVLMKASLSTIGSDKCIVVDWLAGYQLSLKQEKDDFFYPLTIFESYINYYKNCLLTIINHLNYLLNGVYIEINRKSLKNVKGYNEEISLVTTAPKTQELKSLPVDVNLCGHLQFVKYSTKAGQKTVQKMKIVSEVIDNCIQALNQYIEGYYKRIWYVFDNLITYLLQFNYYDYLINFVGELDFLVSNAVIAQKYKYYKPELIDGKSSFQIKDLRHPIAERLISQEYIANDLNLGLGDQINFNQETISAYGLLLYGINASGKTTLTKAVACVIILAQAGCFVPCYLKYSPYRKIITRMSGDDDMFKGQSLYTVEVMELNTILRNVDEHSLIIGDELCRGTEDRSRLVLTVATIKRLIEKKATFILSTHLHKLTTVKYINDYIPKKLQISHLSFYYDSDHDQAIYDRKLKSGAGSSNYGIDVARLLHLPTDFIEEAYQIENELYPNNSGMDKSKYNSKVYKTKCKLCGSTENLQTHHLKEQHTADADGYIGNFHKNIQHNLEVICQSCHQKLHQENATLIKQQTISGYVLTKLDNLSMYP